MQIYPGCRPATDVLGADWVVLSLKESVAFPFLSDSGGLPPPHSSRRPGCCSSTHFMASGTTGPNRGLCCLVIRIHPGRHTSPWQLSHKVEDTRTLHENNTTQTCAKEPEGISRPKSLK